MTLNSSIFAGSPAEKADLEVADEILEVNGESLENSNHTEVIAHIHNVRMNLPFPKKTRLKSLSVCKAA